MLISGRAASPGAHDARQFIRSLCAEKIFRFNHEKGNIPYYIYHDGGMPSVENPIILKPFLVTKTRIATYLHKSLILLLYFHSLTATPLIHQIWKLLFFRWLVIPRNTLLIHLWDEQYLITPLHRPLLVADFSTLFRNAVKILSQSL